MDHKTYHNNPTPIKLYVPCYSQEVREANLKEEEKIKEANFIEPSIYPFAAPMVYVQKGYKRVFVSLLIFQMNNKNVINNTYPLNRIDDQVDSIINSA